jgi:hypothetical protein
MRKGPLERPHPHTETFRLSHPAMLIAFKKDKRHLMTCFCLLSGKPKYKCREACTVRPDSRNYM